MYSPVPFLQQSVQETNQNKQVRPTEHTDVDRTAMQSQGNNNTSRCYQWKWNPLNVCDGFVMFPWRFHCVLCISVFPSTIRHGNNWKQTETYIGRHRTKWYNEICKNVQTYVSPPYMTFSLCFMCSPCQSVVVAVVVALCKVLSVLFSTEFTWKKLSTEVYLDKVWKQLKTNRLENNWKQTETNRTHRGLPG